MCTQQRRQKLTSATDEERAAAAASGLQGIKELHAKLRQRCADCGAAPSAARGAGAVKLAACGRCRMVFYCCAEHQKAQRLLAGVLSWGRKRKALA